MTPQAARRAPNTLPVPVGAWMVRGIVKKGPRPKTAAGAPAAAHSGARRTGSGTDASMPANPNHLGTESLISQWLENPRGRAILLNVLARRGTDVRALYAIQSLPLSSIITLSRGNVTAEQLELLVEAANQGMAPTNPELAYLFPSAPPPSPLDWKEGIIPGRFREKTIIVTGAGSGIGRATALRLASEDARVIAVDLNTLRLEALLENPAVHGTGLMSPGRSVSHAG